MKTNNENGRMLCIIIGAYLIAKAVLNMVIGGGFSLSDMLIAVGLTCAMLTGIKFVNYGVAAVLVLIAAIHLPANISNISSINFNAFKVYGLNFFICIYLPNLKK